jgi:hypothetical protein
MRQRLYLMEIIVMPMLLISPYALAQDSWQGDIDWAFHDTGTPNCPDQYISANNALCLANGNRSCLMGVAKSWAHQTNGCGEAMKLTLITQCHNNGAQDRLRDAGRDAICIYLGGNPANVSAPTPPPKPKRQIGMSGISSTLDGGTFSIRGFNSTNYFSECTVKVKFRHACTLCDESPGDTENEMTTRLDMQPGGGARALTVLPWAASSIDVISMKSTCNPPIPGID